MPANKKYLSSGWQRFAKVTAAILGSLLISSFLFAALAFWLPDYKTAVVTSIFGLFPVWITLMVLPFLFENGWKCWLYYLGILILLTILIHFGRN
ncbi:hypothetical protein [Fluviicola sp.]|uniref:hypothetical protein n=1 Tax=Fluviicola sp. TaxID=1917219 RepID=UPI0026176BF4|nr:hypothetical protein [Fluviicola sp.]